MAIETDPPRVAETPDLSVLVPVTERPAALEGLLREISEALTRAGYRAEFLFGVEPVHRDAAGPLEGLKTHGVPVRVIQVGQAVGEGALLKLLAEHARAATVLTLPAYHRIVTEDLPGVVEALARDGADLVVARRWPRRDSWLNRLQNRGYHMLLRPMGDARLNDVACGVRAMPRQLLLELPLYGDLHRFLPFIALREGYRVREVDGRQHPQDKQARVYSPGTYLRRIIDLVGMFFLLRFTERPLRFFGFVGLGTAAVGVAILLLTVVQRYQGVAMADRPVLLLGVLLVVLGAQAVALGLVGEIIVHLAAPHRTSYRLRDPETPPGS